MPVFDQGSIIAIVVAVLGALVSIATTIYTIKSTNKNQCSATLSEQRRAHLDIFLNEVLKFSSDEETLRSPRPMIFAYYKLCPYLEKIHADQLHIILEEMKHAYWVFHNGTADLEKDHPQAKMEALSARTASLNHLEKFLDNIRDAI